jgi:hypothetical protein
MKNEFKKDEYISLFNYHGLPLGRMLSYSKSGYRDAHPDNIVVFNANILSEKSGKIWYGDVDCTLDKNKLQEISDTLNENLYILYESDCRFDSESKPIEELISKAVVVINCK